MTMLAGIYHDFANNPLIAGVLVATWAILVALGMLARRFRRQSRWFEWLVWTYVVMAVFVAIPAAGAILSGGIFLDRYYFESRPLYAALSLLTLQIEALLWPLLWVGAVVASMLNGIENLSLMLLVTGPLVLAMALAAGITFATHGLPQRIRRRPHADAGA
jgi:hypothetical protein